MEVFAWISWDLSGHLHLQYQKVTERRGCYIVQSFEPTVMRLLFSHWLHHSALLNMLTDKINCVYTLWKKYYIKNKRYQSWVIIYINIQCSQGYIATSSLTLNHLNRLLSQTWWPFSCWTLNDMSGSLWCTMMKRLKKKINLFLLKFSIWNWMEMNRILVHFFRSIIVHLLSALWP